MKSYLFIYNDDIRYEPTDKIDNLIYLHSSDRDLVEIGLNIKVSKDLSNKESVIMDYIHTSLYMKQEVAEEFLAFLSFEYQTVGVFMKFSEGKHPIDCLTNFYMKYCRDYQKKTMSVYQYVELYLRKCSYQSKQDNENILLSDWIKEVEINYDTFEIQAHFTCEFMWLEEKGIEVANEAISLFLDERGMKKAMLTFLNPCLIEQE